MSKIISVYLNCILTRFGQADRAHCEEMSAASQHPPSRSNTSTLPHPSTPSKQRGSFNLSQGSLTRHGDHPRDGRTTPLQENTTAPCRPAPTTPSRCHNTSNRTWIAPETPKRRRENASKRLPGIKSQLPKNLSLESIRTRLIKTLGLCYNPDDWQVHLVRRILQGYDSIFCAGTGYGKSLIFEALAVLGGQGKLVIVISPLKALEHDQVSFSIFALYFSVLISYSSNRQIRPRQRASRPWS
jgi:hypothetical protein